ncbi:MAG TPA: hypothetical protein VFH27_07975 [Longimicrobiaceae bacterium]|nr:hypothetical protein [Longimicrobiaceae bacterium]
MGPLARIPLVGSLRAWDLWPGASLVLAGLAVLALALQKGGRGAWTWVPAILAPPLALYTLGMARPVVAVSDSALAGEGVGMRRAGISVLTGDFAIGWGMVALLCGAVLLCAAAGWAALEARPRR